LNYSKSEPKVTGGRQKQDAMGIRFGAIAANWDAGISLGLGSNATGNAVSLIPGVGATVADPDSTYKGTTGFKVNGGYWFDKLYAYASYYQDGTKLESAANSTLKTEIAQSQYEIGVIDTMKADTMSFFYGVSYVGFTSKAKDTTATVGALVTAVENAFIQEQTQLPFIIGVEAEATSWLTLRASAKQNVLLGSSKVNTADATTVANNTTVAVGAGMKFNKFNLDSTLLAGSIPGTAGNGVINANNLMANASLTYLF
jgi:hypothetical protein